VPTDTEDEANELIESNDADDEASLLGDPLGFQEEASLNDDGVKASVIGNGVEASVIGDGVEASVIGDGEAASVIVDDEVAEEPLDESDVDSVYESSNASVLHSSDEGEDFEEEYYHEVHLNDRPSDESQFNDGPSNETQFNYRPQEDFQFNDKPLDAQTELRQFLAEWVTSQGISGASTNALLKGLKSLQYLGDMFTSNLPSDVRTLLRTPRQVPVQQMQDGGFYYHFGFENGIQDRLALMELHQLPSEVQVFVNNDGIPLSKSSQSELWACCGLLRGEQQPFPIALHHSKGKPACPNEYLTKTVEEANKLRRDGIVHRGRNLAVKIVGFCNDAPARSFICGISGHTGYYSCPKCRTHGRYFTEPGRKRGRVVYPDMDAALRSHQLFTDRENPEHHKQRTVLEDLVGIDMVNDFPHDYMHLVCLGVMRKLLWHWVRRTAYNDIITEDKVDEISKRLLDLRNIIPTEFSRHPRSLVDLCRWKATELRQFLLYTGPVVLKGLLPDRLYQHFLCLHVAIKLLVSEQLCYKFNKYAKQLLRHFVKESGKLYGGHFISYNVHGLIHLADDVLRYGPLDSFSCFPFENFLQTLKRHVRRSLNPLVQIVKRTTELVHCSKTRPSNDDHDSVILSHPHSKGPLHNPTEYLVRATQFQVAKFKNWRLTIKVPNNIVIMGDGSIVKILNFLSNGHSAYVCGVKFVGPSCLLDPPLNVNGILNCKSVSSQNVSDLMCWPLESVKSKAFAIPYREVEEYDDDFVDENDEGFFLEYAAIFPLLMEDKFR
jgi:hypothetical protein